MTNLDKLEDLLRRSEKEKAYELINEDKGITAEILINEGISFGIIKEYDLSISYFELTGKIAEDESIKGEARENLAVTYNNRGNAYDEIKQHERAIEDYSKAIELNPNLAGAYYNRGVAYHEIKQHEKAIEDYNKAIELNPNLAEAYNNRGLAYREIKQHERAIEDYNKAIELNPNLAVTYANRGITQLQTNEELDKAIKDFKHARALFEGRDKERMLGFIEWAKARKEMTMKNWDKFRERMNEAKETFEQIKDPLSISISAFIEFSYLDEKLDTSLNITEPIEALEEIETVLRNLPKVEGLIDPERTIFGARIASFAILSEFIGSVKSIDENTGSGVVKAKLTKLLEESRKVEEAFKSVNFAKGKTAIVDIQEIISLVNQEMEGIKWAADENQKALEILEEYWSRLSPAIRVMNGVSTSEMQVMALGRQIEELKAITSKGFERMSEEHKEILETIYETENILMQKDVINARYRIEFPSISPPRIIIDIPMGTLTEAQIEEKAEEIMCKIKSVKDEVMGKVKEDIFNALKCIPEKIGGKLLKRLKKTKV